MDIMQELAKMKVQELRDELKRRCLNTAGVKQALMERLKEAILSDGPYTGSLQIPYESKVLQSDHPSAVSNNDNEGLHESEEPFDEDEEDACNGGSVNAGGSFFAHGTQHNMPSATQAELPHTEEVVIKSDRLERDSNSSSDSSPKRRNESSPRREGGSNPRREGSDTRSGEKRKYNDTYSSRRSPPRANRSRSWQGAQNPKICPEPDGWEFSESVFMDTYNCDLNLVVDADGYTARPLSDEGFSHMWAGGRMNYGLVDGKAFYEVKIIRNLTCENLDSFSGGAAHVLRVGWSNENCEFALGEEPFSYGYGGTGKKSCDNRFSDYGCKFSEGDIVGAFLELTHSEAILSFCVNGVHQGECYRLNKASFGEYGALFPHIYSKNVEYEINVGQNGQPPWFSPQLREDDPLSWSLLENVDVSRRVHSRRPPSSKAECEVIMMIGLPGAGKTYWADNLRKENREKQYNILGTNDILDKMKILGLVRKRNYHGRWDVLIDKATKCLNALITLASHRRRNYVLDQTNVYPSAQRRKMRPFEGYHRKAVVIVPTDDEFRRRIAQREKEEGKEVPESAVLEMKANFGVPVDSSMDHSSVFDEVIFTELGRNEAEILVKQYNAEGEAAKPPPEKRSRFSDSFSGGSNTGSARDRFSSGSTGRDYGDTGWRDRDRSPSNARYSGHDKRDDWRGDFRQERGRGRGYGDYRGRGYEDRGDRDRFDRDSRGRGRTGGFRGARGRGGGGYGSGFGASGDDFGYNRGGYGGQRGGRGGGGYDNYSHDDRGAGFRRGGPPRGGSRSGSGSGYQPSEDKYKSEYDSNSSYRGRGGSYNSRGGRNSFPTSAPPQFPQHSSNDYYQSQSQRRNDSPGYGYSGYGNRGATSASQGNTGRSGGFPGSYEGSQTQENPPKSTSSRPRQSRFDQSGSDSTTNSSRTFSRFDQPTATGSQQPPSSKSAGPSVSAYSYGYGAQQPNQGKQEHQQQPQSAYGGYSNAYGYSYGQDSGSSVANASDPSKSRFNSSSSGAGKQSDPSAAVVAAYASYYASYSGQPGAPPVPPPPPPSQVPSQHQTPSQQQQAQHSQAPVGMGAYNTWPSGVSAASAPPPITGPTGMTPNSAVQPSNYSAYYQHYPPPAPGYPSTGMPPPPTGPPPGATAAPPSMSQYYGMYMYPPAQ